VNRLTVPLAAITPAGASIDVTVSAAEFQPQGAEGAPFDAVTVRGTLWEAAQEYMFQGTISGAFQHPCDRCLDAAECPFSVQVTWIFKQGYVPEAEPDTIGSGQEETEETVRAFEGNEIDLAQGTWEEIILAMPAKFLCREECAGLCPQCGANLNRDTCTCRADGAMENKGLAGLADLFPRLGPKGLKE
jgi:uncharacterized protein